MGWMDLVVWVAVLTFTMGASVLVGIIGMVLFRSMYLIALDAVQIVRRR